MQAGSVGGDTVKVLDMLLLVACTSTRGEDGVAKDRSVNGGDVGSHWRCSPRSSIVGLLFRQRVWTPA